jgi:hypothetical protein
MAKIADFRLIRQLTDWLSGEEVATPLFQSTRHGGRSAIGNENQLFGCG